MTIDLSPENQEFVETAIASGNYADREDVVNAALRLFRHRQQCLDELKADIQAGMDSGDPLTSEAVFEHLERKVDALSRRAAHS